MAHEFNAVSGLDHAFLRNGKIKATPSTLGEAFDNIVAPELEAQLVTGHSRLSDDQFAGTNSKPVTNIDRILAQAGSR